MAPKFSREAEQGGRYSPYREQQQQRPQYPHKPWYAQHGSHGYSDSHGSGSWHYNDNHAAHQAGIQAALQAGSQAGLQPARLAPTDGQMAQGVWVEDEAASSASAETYKSGWTTGGSK